MIGLPRRNLIQFELFYRHVAKGDTIIAINLSSAFHTTRLTLPTLRAHGWGRIVNLASARA